MGLIDLFKRKAPKPNAKGPAADEKHDMSERCAVSEETLGKLIKALDNAINNLPSRGFDAPTTARYAEMIGAMRDKIKGISEASAPVILPDALLQMFEKSLLTALLYGDAKQQGQLLKVISDGIQALTSTETKAQQLAAISLNIASVVVEKWAMNFQYEQYKADYWAECEKYPDMDEFDPPLSIQSIALSIKSCENRIEALEAQLAELRGLKRDIEAATDDKRIAELDALLRKLVASLPTQEDMIKQGREITVQKEKREASVRANIAIRGQELGGLGGVYAKMRKEKEAKARQKQQEQQEAPSKAAQTEKAETAEASEGVVISHP